MEILGFFARKVLRVVVVVIGTTLLAFLLMHMIPGNPWSNYSSNVRAMKGIWLDAAQEKELNRRFGLDLPLWRQYTRYIVGDFDEQGEFFCGAICGNLGPSIQQRGRTVQDFLFAAPDGGSWWRSPFGYSIRLVFFASCIAVGLGIPLGFLTAARAQTRLKRAVSFGLAALISIPNFVLGLLAMIVFASWLKLIPVLPNWNQPAHWIIPAVVLAAMPIASIARVTQTTLENTLNEDYILTARAKGMTERRVMRVHVLRNALVPITTFLGPVLMEMFGGLFIVENLYAFPGFGRGYWDAILKLDYSLAMGVLLLYAVGIGVVNVGIATLCEILDPRLRAAEEGTAA